MSYRKVTDDRGQIRLAQELKSNQGMAKGKSKKAKGESKKDEKTRGRVSLIKA